SILDEYLPIFMQIHSTIKILILHIASSNESPTKNQHPSINVLSIVNFSTVPRASPIQRDRQPPSSINKPKPNSFSGSHFDKIACLPLPTVVGRIIACKLKLSISHKGG